MSSILMLAVAPPELWASFPDLVLTSVMTSIGLILFCFYDLAPLVVALLLGRPGASGPGLEMFVMLGGVVTTMSFLLLQARLASRRLGTNGRGPGSTQVQTGETSRAV